MGLGEDGGITNIFTAENAVQEQAKWPLNAGCLVCRESIINAALLVISALAPSPS